MASVSCIVGCSYGDEGKGKIVDFLSQQDFDITVRYQGGDNAGHTVSINNNVFKLNLIPTGILTGKNIAVLTHGVVINLKTLLTEIAYLEKKDITVKDRLFISQNAHLLLSFHAKYDSLIENLNNQESIGTTKKGIGYAYSDKIKRINLQIKDLFDSELCYKKLVVLAEYYNKIFQEYGVPLVNLDEEMAAISHAALQIKPFVCDTNKLLRNAIKKNKKILLEGAQGVLLDIDYGNYPYVTSSSVANFYTNSGLNYLDIANVIGVVKAYSTRVGNGVFVTEIEDESIADKIREKGNEYGTVTGRKRRIGWLDLVALKYAISLCGIKSIAVTLVDVLSVVDRIKVCVDYNYPETMFQDIFNPNNQPIYIEFPGWKEDISQIRNWEDLPNTTKIYLRFIAKFLGVKITHVSVGRQRDDMVVVND